MNITTKKVFYSIISILIFTYSYSQTENINLNAHRQGLRLINSADSAGTYVTFTDHDGKSANISSFDDNYADANYRNSLQFFARNGKDFKFATSPNGNAGTNKLVILNNGNIGIGTVSPGTWKLAVNGNIRAKEIKVETGWSDFVFYNDYELPTLLEVENHIKEKGHLKDIPSAKEVKANGILLGEMNSKLLQKIEELTLYTIQQQKEIENLKKENKEVKLLNKKLLELQYRLEKLESEK